MIKCLWTIGEEQDARGWRVATCERCGKRIKTPHEPQDIHARCKAWPFAHEWGSWLALFLSAIFITPQFVNGVIDVLNLREPATRPGCECGCEARKKWLNSLGGRTVMAWRRLRGWLTEQQSP